ncbi:MAG: hypothetical protein H8E37_08580 [Planctomycetes bacterium]|nr:hypothetical protein [Planctomycetota bacterium]
MNTEQLAAAYEAIREEATTLAGGLTDLAQRATVYHHVYRHSGGNHAFPLIAAHGALWARGYFAMGLKLAKVLSLQFALSPKRRREQLAALREFSDVFRNINRCVCIDIYTNYHFTARYGEHEGAAKLVDAELLAALKTVHSAREDGRELSDAEKREVFQAHFMHEQAHVVGPRIEAAMAEFQWPLVREIAMRPLVKFAFCPRRFWFRNFASRDDRVEKGLRAFDTAVQVGWERVEDSLSEYDVLPRAFFADSVAYFTSMSGSVLGRPAMASL